MKGNATILSKKCTIGGYILIPNRNFIDKCNESEPADFYCDICGEEDLIPSRIIIECNYGSIYDGECLTLEVCGDCIDKIYNNIIEAEKERS